MRYIGQFNQSQLIFGKGHAELHPYRGLVGYGPYGDPTDHFDEAVILHAPDEEASAERLRGLLSDGLQPQFPRGFGQLFNSQVKITRLELSSGVTEAEKPHAFLEKFMESGASGRLPIPIIERTPRGSFPSVYYDTKSLFVREGLVTQIVTTQVLSNPDILKWSLLPIAMQLYTKMGGLPYVLYEKMRGEVQKSVTFVVGVGISRLQSRYGAGPAFVGFALLFGPNGEWKIMKSEVRGYDRATLAEMFRNLVRGVATTIFSHYLGESSIDAINMIIHYSGKNMSGEEERALWSATSEMESLYGKQVLVSIVKVGDSSYQAKVDGSACTDRMGLDTGLLTVGTTFEVKPHFFMMFTIGCLPLGDRYRATGLGSPAPILVSVKGIGGEPGMDDGALLRSVFDFCRMNYSSVNNPVNRTPITVTYAREIAFLMGKLGLNEVPESVSSRLWFI